MQRTKKRQQHRKKEVLCKAWKYQTADTDKANRRGRDLETAVVYCCLLKSDKNRAHPYDPQQGESTPII